MADVFMDTGGLIALFHRRDRLSDLAHQWLMRLKDENPRWVTTTAVLTEVLDGFAQHQLRHYSKLLSTFLDRTSVVDVVNVDLALFEKGWAMYESYGDKNWGLTDCISFIVMQEKGIKRALAHDIHFAQAGFRPLLREAP